MKQEDKEILLKDLCTRLPYGVVLNVDVLNIDCFLCVVYQNKDHPDCVGIGDNGIASIERVKPYLRPMSSMTDEEKEEFENLLEGIVDGIERWDKPDLCEEYDWLNSHHFDYRGLIEKGLALEAQEGMYNVKKK